MPIGVPKSGKRQCSPRVKRVAINCTVCGTERLYLPSEVRQRSGKYCSQECAYGDRSGERNANYKGAGWHKCKSCRKPFHNYNKGRKYCSRQCYAASRPNIKKPRGFVVHRTKAKKDNNHNEIVDALEKCGVQTFDMSHQGGGFPDLLCCLKGDNHLVEIKNPDTYYGRSGLNDLQQEFADRWTGAPVYIISTLDDVENFASSKLDKVPHYGGQST